MTFVASDNCGNQSEITGVFIVEPAAGNVPVHGVVATETAETVEDVAVTIDGSGFNNMFQTAENGFYGFSNVETAQNYTITPYLNQDPLNGISTYDLVLISKHILQIQALDSPYKMIAADINNNGSISTVDLVELRKLILFIDDEFQNNTSWRFVPASFVFPQADNPFATVFPEIVNINELSEEEIHDFVGIKVGDVNNSVTANSLVAAEDRTVAGDVTMVMADAKMSAGNEYEIPVTAENFDAISGYQFTINFDATQVEFVGTKAGNLSQLSDANFGLTMLDEGVITTSWNSNNSQSLAADEVLFYLTFKATADAQLSDVLSISSRYTVAEAYNSDLDLFNVTYRFDGNDTANNNFALYQNKPNPFKATTVIGFELPAAGAATLTVFDVSGRTLKMIDGEFAKGYNEVSLSKEELQGSGLLYYRLVTDNFEATKKMMIIK